MNGKIDRLKIIEQAEKYVRLGKLKEAIQEYEKLIEDDPSDVSVNNIFGDLYVRLGQTDRAITAFERVANEYEKKSLYSQALAIIKKICRLNPNNAAYFIKMADLSARQGFIADAKQEYLRLAERFLREKNVEEAISLYEKVIKLDREDFDIRMKLAALYKLDGRTEKAVEELLEAVNYKLSQGQLDDAEKFLREIKKLSPEDNRADLKLAQVLRLKGQGNRAIELAEAVLKKEPNSLEAMTLLGNLYYEEGKLEAAKDMFIKILNTYPSNVNARYRLGRIQLAEGEVDRAFEYFEPLIENYLKKKREEKAVGLLGLILSVRRDYLPAMEKMAEILRQKKDSARLEIIDRAIIEELKKIGEKARLLSYYAELVKLRPTDQELAQEYRKLKKELMVSDEEIKIDTWAPSPEEEEEIQAGLAQAEVYQKEGLIRLARRVIEGLLLKFPNDSLLKQKLNELNQLRPTYSEDELIKKVEKTTIIETQVIKPSKVKPEPVKEAKKKTGFPLQEQILSEDKISPVDIFADTGIIPIISSDGKEKKFYDLEDSIRTELNMLSAIYLEQKKGVTTQFEKELSSIVADFRKGIRDKIPEEDYQIHLQLGLAFMEQNLIDEAIEEFNLASKDKNLTLECLTLISHCYRLKGNLEEAEHWLNRAIKLVAPGSDQYFALMFDMGLIHEKAGEVEKALNIYREIQSWNPTYRSVSEKISRLSGMSGTSGSPLN
ncbi:MAG: tetratricopeptide repeat protein [Candidatus Aminicenantes bacterium]|nr:tetratricopeptide repeat protein [Candidatus Aminicenantes bacterium]